MGSRIDESRRDFLKTAALAGGGLVIGFVLPAGGRLAQAAGAEFRPNAYLRIGADGTVTVVCGLSEMGQGVLTAIPMLVAEELEADWSTVRVEQAPADKAFANPVYGIQATGGSTAVRGHFEPMRKAGAAAREMLIAAAAGRWKVDPSECRAEKGFVLHGRGRKLSYGQLAEAAARQPVPTEVTLKDYKDSKILGKGLKRLDTPPKVDGSARFGLDVYLPGMLTAVMARPPVPGARLASVDDAKAKAIRGVRQVIRIPAGVAVLADGFWAAKQGRDALEIKWDEGPAAELSSEGIRASLAEAAAKGGAVGRNEGRQDAPAGRAIESVYEAPYLAHACMEPMNCTAWVKSGEAEVWAGTQAPGPTQAIVAGIAGVPPEKVKVNTMYLGGGYGRRFAPDFTAGATLLSKLSGKPVKLVYTREDDMQAAFYRPASVTRFRGALDERGRIVSLAASVASPSLMESSGMMKIPENGVDRFAVEGIEDHPYDIPNVRIEYARVEPGYKVWFWRSVGHSQNSFFMEGFVDELAVAAGRDPFEFRRAHLGKAPRYKGVLELAAAKAGWGSPMPAGRARGIAVAHSFGSYVAEIAEVSVGRDGRVRVHRVVCAVDCGMTVNPEIVRRQMESSIVLGLTAALYGKITVRNGRVEQSNFHDYPMLRMHEMPAVEVHILPSTETPGGVGEPGLPPLAPAVVNAIYALTGKRVRKLPIDPAELKTA